MFSGAVVADGMGPDELLADGDLDGVADDGDLDLPAPVLVADPVVGAGEADVAKLIYISNVSLDGFIEDARGSFDWTAPDEEVFAFITDLVRSVGTYLYGRRMYETMAVWETDATLAAQSEPMADFAKVWQAADKVVYSTTLQAASTARTRLERSFHPDSVRDIAVGHQRSDRRPREPRGARVQGRAGR